MHFEECYAGDWGFSNSDYFQFSGTAVQVSGSGFPDALLGVLGDYLVRACFMGYYDHTASGQCIQEPSPTLPQASGGFGLMIYGAILHDFCKMCVFSAVSAKHCGLGKVWYAYEAVERRY